MVSTSFRTFFSSQVHIETKRKYLLGLSYEGKGEGKNGELRSGVNGSHVPEHVKVESIRMVEWK